MKKYDLFPILDNQEKRVNQTQGLSNLLVNAGGLPDHSKRDRSACQSIVTDLASNKLSQHDIIALEVTQLVIVSNYVAGIE
jgi:hypothetical protein